MDGEFITIEGGKVFFLLFLSYVIINIKFVYKGFSMMIKKIMEANYDVYPGGRELAVLRAYFPSCFLKDGSFDIERFRALLSDRVAVVQEGYGLEFLGKNYARLLASVDTITLVQPDLEHNALPENADSENIYISGDNLDGLKHLLKSYAGKIKCIYIDPPYNTGSDGFVYNDSFHFTEMELARKLSIHVDEAHRILDLTRRGAASHSAWLMFMYPRLLLARDLLTSDGVIFISIDDNEQGNLKLLCDDVFGEENFLACFPRVTKKGGKSSEDTAKNHDYILAYSSKAGEADLIGVAHTDKGYAKKDQYFEERGYYKANQTLDYDSLGYVQSLDYPIELEGKIFVAGGDMDAYEQRQRGLHRRADWAWRWSRDLFEFGLENGFIEVHAGGARPRIYTKTYQKVKIKKVNGQYQIVKFDRTKPLSTLEFTDNKYSNDNARKVFEMVMPKGVFEYTKPPELIKQLIRLVNGDHFYVCDFFAGSSSTAQAVMELSAENGERYKFIQIQLPEKVKLEEAKRQGFYSIDQIGIERIRRIAKKICADNAFAAREQDLGFRHYTLIEPSQNILDTISVFDPSDNRLFSENILEVFGRDTVLATWLVGDGYGFTACVQEADFAGYTAYYMDRHLYMIDRELSINAIVAILERFETVSEFNPENIVLFGYSFTWAEREQLEINLKRLRYTEKNLHVNIDIRY